MPLHSHTSFAVKVNRKAIVQAQYKGTKSKEKVLGVKKLKMENSTVRSTVNMNCFGLKGKVTQSEKAILSYFLICISKTKGIDRLPEFFFSEELIFEFLLNLKDKKW
jgi:hypothetical protein